jgi:hypothetical protein
MIHDTFRLIERFQSEARDAQATYRALSAAERDAKSLVEPRVPTDTEVLAQCLEVGTRAMQGYRAPNVILGINEPDLRQKRARQSFGEGVVLTLETIVLWSGAEILALDASPEEGPDWDVVSLRFASLDVIHAFGGPVPLSSLTHLTCDDLLSVFKHKKTKVDIPVNIQVMC